MKIANKTTESLNSNNSLKILKGSALSIIITIVALVIFALVLAYTNTPENVVVPVIIAIAGISILIGSIFCSVKIRKQGLINGGLVGLIYVAIIYILSSIIDKDFSLDTSSIIMCLTCVLTGMTRWNYWS